MTPARRTRIAWLHRWAGLVTGWAAFAIFLTGSLALFDTELTRWMQPETATVPYGAQLTPYAMARAQQILLASNQAGDAASFLLLPDPRDPTLRILHYDGHNFVGPVLDPRSGALIPARQTEGGAFFFNFHYTLYLPDPWGQRVVACVAFAFAALVLSGVLLHLKRLVPDYFTLRLQASLPRSLLDLHVLMGSAMLPFHVMITWSGLVLTAENALPLIQSDHAAYMQDAPTTPAASLWAPHASLSLMLQEAETYMGLIPSYVLFDGGQTTFSGIVKNSLNANDLSVVFDSQTGAFVSRSVAPSSLENAFYILNGLHLARSMGPLLRWLWFCGGLASAAMVASGLVYYTVRQKKQGQATFNLAQRLNVVLIGGLIMSCLSFLALNRLIPAWWQDRAAWEIGGFLGIWACSLILSLLCTPSKSWRIITWATAITGLAIPLLDIFLLPPAIWRTALHMTVNGLCGLTGFFAVALRGLLAAQNSHD